MPEPDAVSTDDLPVDDHEALHDRWEDLQEWRTVRRDIRVLRRAVQRAARHRDAGGDGSASDGSSPGCPMAFHPGDIAPRVLELQLDTGQYPDAVNAARLDVRWFEDGSYTAHYLEIRGDDVWQCGWDRHPKPEAPIAHFHPPPDAGVDIEPSTLAVSHPLEVLFSVLAWIEERIQRLFEN